MPASRRANTGSITSHSSTSTHVCVCHTGCMYYTLLSIVVDFRIKQKLAADWLQTRQGKGEKSHLYAIQCAWIPREYDLISVSFVHWPDPPCLHDHPCFANEIVGFLPPPGDLGRSPNKNPEQGNNETKSPPIKPRSKPLTCPNNRTKGGLVLAREGKKFKDMEMKRGAKEWEWPEPSPDLTSTIEKAFPGLTWIHSTGALKHPFSSPIQ